MTQPLSRRTLLKGVGAAVALPVLDAMLPALASAAPAATGTRPTRLAWLYVPNGKHMADWTPATEGAGYKTPWIMEPLEAHKGDFSVLTGLTLDKARANGDGGGDHARANAAFLTGRQPRKTYGADLRAGLSIDQFAADRVGRDTKFGSIELGCERGGQAGNCDSGYSCAYSSSISWRGETTPAGKEIDPKGVFERLFGAGDPKESAATRAKREAYNKSILDFVLADAKSLHTKLGATDRNKMDEYLTSVRELEERIAKARRMADQPVFKPGMAAPSGVPKDYAEHIKLMFDLMVVAYQGDVTRVATFSLANDGSNRPYSQIGVAEGHHDLSHHAGDPKKHAKIRQINRFHIEQLAYFLGKLKATQDGDATLLDRCMVVYGSGISDGNRHNHDDLPVLVAGRGNGSIKPGRHLRYKKETPLMNLYVTMMQNLGVKCDKFGDSTGRLEVNG